MGTVMHDIKPLGHGASSNPKKYYSGPLLGPFWLETVSGGCEGKSVLLCMPLNSKKGRLCLLQDGTCVKIPINTFYYIFMLAGIFFFSVFFGRFDNTSKFAFTCSKSPPPA